MANGNVGYDRLIDYDPNSKGQIVRETINRAQWDGDSYDPYKEIITHQ